MDLGIYIQVPFCQAKCTYCNFHTGVFSPSLYAPYVSAVCDEILNHRALYRQAGVDPPPAEWVVDTVYLGGGTPSLLAPEDLARLLDAVRTQFPCAWREATLEADPETVTPQKAAAWRAAGINRISLGVQSLEDRELRAAGRQHRRADVFAAFGRLRDAGFENLSFDLIAGLPHQTVASWETSLAGLIELRPEHVSIYMLEIDEHSRLGAAVLAGSRKYSADRVPDEDTIAEFYRRACQQLEAAGYEHYEISNWALLELDGAPVERAGPSRFRSQHNQKYWRRQPYLGFGAGAHSFNGRQRWANGHDPAHYVAALARGQLPVEQLEEIGRQQALEEAIFLGLRQREGIDLAALEAEYNVSFAEPVSRLSSAEWVTFVQGRLRLTPAALTTANAVLVELLEGLQPVRHTQVAG
ncbi:MAG: radical SAM family heme chaperone HemW [Firmicutes bacterium]|nr:radical SAM family heme chaperone HemW [Bacillota bacterium]